jgi:hypothetical protein
MRQASRDTSSLFDGIQDLRRKPLAVDGIVPVDFYSLHMLSWMISRRVAATAFVKDKSTCDARAILADGIRVDNLASMRGLCGQLPGNASMVDAGMRDLKTPSVLRRCRWQTY